MKFTVYDVPQRSDEWHQLRVGLLTGTAAKAIVSVRKKGSGELKERADLRRRLVCERLTGISAENTKRTDAMQRGTDLEPEAFSAYEAVTGQVVNRVGFIKHQNWRLVAPLTATSETGKGCSRSRHHSPLRIWNTSRPARCRRILRPVHSCAVADGSSVD